MHRAIGLGLALFCADATAQQAQAMESRPTILFVGDVSFANHHSKALAALKDRAVAKRSTLGHLPTGPALARLDEVLDGGPWDVVCFNFGLGDLMFRDPNTEAIRAMSPAAGGVPATPTERYGQNLSAFVGALRERGATPVFCTTLPLRPRGRSSAVSSDAIATYNAVAVEVMRALDVPVVDTHAQIQTALDAVANPRNRDRTYNQLLKGDLSGPLVEALDAVLSRAGDEAPAPAAGMLSHELLTEHCARCHGSEQKKGDVRFDRLAALTPGDRAELLGRARDALAFEEMPPEDEPQPSPDERRQLREWMTAQIETQDGGDSRDRLRYPQYGNLVDHEALFGGPPASAAAAFSPARRWRVNPQIFHERVMDVFKLEGRARQQMRHRSFAGVVNPFVQTDASGVRDYDLGSLDGGHLLVMLGNAAWIADRQIAIARAVAGEKVTFADPKDRWMPRPLPASYAAFAALLQGDGAPAEGATDAAIREQFDCVLRRAPTEPELVRYRGLMRSAIELGDNRDGLRQMLTGVLLESEFVYRLEFGAGPEDEHGRRLLAPREAADAIAYALGDRRPDAALRAAADEGRLGTRADFEREVRRLLDDTDHFRGQIDPSLNGKHFKSNVTSHPKIVRFFREFFGYPAATKVFKDPPRSGGIYRNPHRGTAATPGRLILETDRMVTRIVEADREVFERLLTTDEFFVYHDKDNEKGAEIIEQWRSVYERLADTPWRTEPEAVLAEHLEFLKGIPSMRVKDDSRPGELVNYMHFFEEHFGRGITPFTTVPWAHGYTFHHAPLYNLPPTPSIGRYGSWKSTEYRGEKVDDRAFWDYPTEQPFRIEHRKGILTHPSWLIAHSTNFFPDAVRRGRWIREKLLAGRVPDVPITVDARVPEDPHRTFRQRLEEVTSGKECWRCHQHMNPLGLPFEAFDDFGRFRTEEVLEHPDNLIKRGNGKTTFDVYPTAPVETTGRLDGTGDPDLDGDVADPFELIDRLARADRVRQSILRHAFRFYMGRNETPADARTLVDAERAYLESGGSFGAVIVTLLTSDSFLYRKTVEENP